MCDYCLILTSNDNQTCYKYHMCGTCLMHYVEWLKDTNRLAGSLGQTTLAWSMFLCGTCLMHYVECCFRGFSMGEIEQN